MLSLRSCAFAALATLLLSLQPAFAEETPPAADAVPSVVRVSEPEAARQADLISLGLGRFDVRSRINGAPTEDFRIEYRSGLSLLSLANPAWSSIDSFFQIHPMTGVEVTGDNAAYGFAGLDLDFLIGKYFVVSPNVVVGYFDRGDGKNLGSKVEFRSTFEAGFRLENQMRITGYFSHISNAGLTDKNPGAEMAGAYLHIPLVF